MPIALKAWRHLAPAPGIRQHATSWRSKSPVRTEHYCISAQAADCICGAIRYAAPGARVLQKSMPFHDAAIAMRFMRMTNGLRYYQTGTPAMALSSVAIDCIIYTMIFIKAKKQKQTKMRRTMRATVMTPVFGQACCQTKPIMKT